MSDPLELFRDLALRALERPEDAALREEIAIQLSAHPEWAGEWRELRETHRLAREAAYAGEARAQADRSEEIPAARLAALLGEDIAAPAAAPAAARVHRSHRWRWLGLAAGIALGASTALLMQREPGSGLENFDVTPWLAQAPPTLTRALTATLAEVVAGAQLPTLRNDTAFHLRSPLLATTAGEITVVWSNDVAANLTLVKNGRPVWSAVDVRSGARTPALAADSVYELIVAPATGAAVRERFVTVARGGDTPDESGFAKILRAITAEPARLGDAVVAWHALPAATRLSETGVRLGLWLGVEARQPDLLAEAKKAAAPAPR